MTLKYESEILFDLMKRDGDDAPSDVLPYESELKEKYLNQVEGAYPKLQDYRPEWLYYNLYHHLPSDFPVESVANVTSASFNNVVPYAYKSAILKGSTKYRDIDTGEVLDAFEDGRNLELVSVKMPVLTTVGKNLFDGKIEIGTINADTGEPTYYMPRARTINFLNIKPNTSYSLKFFNDYFINRIFFYDNQKIYIGNRSIDGGNDIITTPENAKYIKISFGKNSSPGLTDTDLIDIIENFQLEEGSVATSYEPYKSNILTVNDDVTLRGIGEGSNRVEDELDLLSGEVTQRIGEIVLDGSENWIRWGSGFLLQGYLSNPMFVSGATNDIRTSYVKCDRFPSIIYSDVYGGTSYGVGINGGNVGISVNGISTLEAFKTNLSENPIKICYPVANKSIKTVDLSCINEQGESVTFKPIEGTMHVSTSSQTLPPLLDMSVPIEATTQNLMSFANIVEEE